MKTFSLIKSRKPAERVTFDPATTCIKTGTKKDKNDIDLPAARFYHEVGVVRGNKGLVRKVRKALRAAGYSHFAGLAAQAHEEKLAAAA